MGLLDRFIKEKDENANEQTNSSRDYANEFISKYKDFEHAKLLVKSLLLPEMSKILDEWSKEGASDANYHLARIIFSKISNNEIDNSSYTFATKIFKPSDKAAYEFLKNTVDGLLNLESPKESGQINDFSYLNDLIRKSNKKEIVLTSDIALNLDRNEDREYNKGILIPRNDLVIDGNGHTVDARNKARIFAVAGKNIIIKNFTFKNAVDDDFGSVIFSGENTSISVENCIFEDNSSVSGGVILSLGKLDVADSKFRNNKSNSYAGVINNLDGFATLSNCEFIENRSDEIGGVIVNKEHMEITNCRFENNFSKGGGAINNQPECQLNISGSEFVKNKANIGGAIQNYGNLNISDSIFSENSADDKGGAIICLDNTLSIENSQFNDNQVRDGDGGAIFCHGKITINDSKFNNNSSNDGGGAISNEGGLNCLNSEFIGNKTKQLGGAIVNTDECTLKGTLFKSNSTTESGGALVSLKKINISNCTFDDNHADKMVGAVFLKNSGMIVNSKFIHNNAYQIGTFHCAQGKFKISSCEFRKNRSDGNIAAIFNQGDLVIENSDFINNSARIISVLWNSDNLRLYDCNILDNSCDDCCILNDRSIKFYGNHIENNTSERFLDNSEGADVSFLSSTFKGNASTRGIIYNNGDCEVSECSFDNNESRNGGYGIAYNESSLNLIKSKFIRTADKSILNNGNMDVKQLRPEEIERLIDDNGNITDLGYIPDPDDVIYGIEPAFEDDSNGFAYLDNLIHGDNKSIDLQDDISLKLGEINFYEGGIELDIDNLVIDGHGHTIEGMNRSRIFHVTAKGITLKNIVFKNGKLLNVFSKHSNGGGVIRILKGCSLTLENCEFIENESQDDGGAIFNRGLLTSSNCSFDKNHSQLFGGVIFNRGTFNSHEDRFNENTADIGSAVYNHGVLNIENPNLSNNESVISQPIFNNNLIISQSESEDSVFNIGRIAKGQAEYGHESFEYLNRQINDSAEIHLDRNIVFDFKNDGEFVNGIIINKDEDMTIDGNGFSIDGKNLSSLFDIQPHNRVIFRNVRFVNSVSGDNPIIRNQGNAIFENCLFDANKVLQDGCLIENGNHMEMYNTSFSNNSSEDGNMIKNRGSIEISDSRFINNFTSKEDIIYNLDGDVAISNSIFITNSSLNGNLINNRKDIKLSSCSFIINSFNNGTIFLNNDNADLEDSIFNRNSSVNEGSAITNRGELNIDNSSFDDNESNTLGVITNSKRILIQNSRFTGNVSSTGAVLHNHSEMEFRKCEFLNNVSKNSAGVIYNAGLNSIISDSIFKGNSCSKFGGAIVNTARNVDEVVNLIVSGCKFEDNKSVGGGGAISNEDLSSIEIVSCEFIENSSEYGAAIYSYGNVKLVDTRFYKNTASKEGGAIFCDDESVRDKDAPLSQMNWGKSFLSVNDCEFSQNKSEKNGGAILAHADVEVVKSKFSDNSAFGGGAIFAYLKINVNGSSFINNSSGINGGGAISNWGNLSLDNSVFEKNKSIGGAAVYSEGIISNVSNCKFIENESSMAPIFDDEKRIGVEFKNCIFRDNTSRDY